MVRRFIVATALAGTAGLALAGCGGGGKKHDGPEVAWAGKACAAMNQGAPLAVPKQLNSANVLQSKASMVKLLDGISTRMASLEVRLQGLGAPPVAGGQALLTTAMSNLTRTHSSVSTATKRLHKAKVTDKRSLQQAIGQVGVAFSAYKTYQGPQQDFRKDPKLNAAFAKAPACRTAQPS
ncbi:hypothetical protein [Actinomadura violacea]|uniref:Lipoprotein n=1 Tax=Actinomadura violacea TaxID=2819934 RepID=A0ABS3S9C6_9ACTN|nr:hypothetical protein [Actinomadura violacea]MBO2464830.1 hypothetical protein [Actinomadura violacea]